MGEFPSRENAPHLQWPIQVPANLVAKFEERIVDAMHVEYSERKMDEILGFFMDFLPHGNFQMVFYLNFINEIFILR